jgi:hypothetical protein
MATEQPIDASTAADTAFLDAGRLAGFATNVRQRSRASRGCREVGAGRYERGRPIYLGTR